MSPLPSVWPYAAIFWAVFLWAFVPEWRIIARRGERSSTPQDARSKQIISLGQGLSGFVAFFVAYHARAGALPYPGACFWSGLALIVAGSLLRRHCWRMLGTSFTGAVIVRPEQTIVERGAYRFVRHPSYTAGLIMFLGTGVALGNWISIAVFVGTGAATYAYRVTVEERALVGTIGEPYLQYMRRTKRFVPRVI